MAVMSPHEQAMLALLALMTVSTVVWAGWCIADDNSYMDTWREEK